MRHKTRAATGRLRFAFCNIAAVTLVALGVLAAGRPAAAAAFYLADSLQEVKPDDRVAVANPQPVQLLFQFETKGQPNARATKLLKQKVVDAVKASGLFSDVSDLPTQNGAILSVVIDDAISQKDVQNAEAQGFLTGLTFGLAASQATDHYKCTVDYVASANATKLTKTAQQDLIFAIGLTKTTPPHAVKMPNGNEAIYEMVRQVISNTLNDLGKDPGFQSTGGPSPKTGP